MKLLDNSKLDAVSSTLSFETPACDITTRVESYSCKMAGDPKKLYKQLRNEPGTSPHDLEILGPSQIQLPMYNYGLLNSPTQMMHINPMAQSISSDDESPLNKTIPRKTLIFLISTLNASFQPDYEFSCCTSQDFSRETNLELVKNAVDSRFISVMGDYYRSVSPQLWSVIDEEINIKESEIFSYHPDGTSDPFSESGIIWSFNFFFHNKKLRRILFLTCRADCKMASNDEDNEEDEPLEFNNYLTFEGVMD
ncbi:unnamed protein product [Rotaria magnacalcarata]|uniref:Repressor of RNA polymerase III transcription MAF1 n=2 Tax=Rotaria magnacalcarata TaxID=392030 RepID=A0A816L1M2_9BILA|nr:unnamed protein product [Rotaria magnacalcarata]CAF1929385.1 unnamed protein product [Rotaria magnacalcarata]CAF2044626.1 unnamed protein product [Rotaria magnacalcarata]CAF2245403.1 unnamed protein product [Rotaria magnacalcarata]